MIRKSGIAGAIAALATAGTVTSAEAGDNWLSGDWYLKIGAAVLHAPEFDGARDRLISVQPIVSLGRQGPSARFSSRNDNVSLAFVDTGTFRAGAAGRIVFPRDGSDSDDLAGLSPIEFGAEVGGFAEVYPTDFLRLRAEVRRGVRSHDGVVADISADAFFDVTDAIQVSGGPRASWATSGYFDAWYGVDAAEAAATGLSQYAPDGGMKSAGVGGAVTWKATDELTASLFAEYSRLMGPAAASSLVRERGSRDQVTVGVSAVYRFDFSL